MRQLTSFEITAMQTAIKKSYTTNHILKFKE